MVNVFNARPNGRFTETNGNLRRKILHRTNKTPISPGQFQQGRLGQEPQPNFKKKKTSILIKKQFSSRTHPSIFTSIASHSNGQMKESEFSQHFFFFISTRTISDKLNLIKLPLQDFTQNRKFYLSGRSSGFTVSSFNDEIFLVLYHAPTTGRILTDKIMILIIIILTIKL